MKTQTRKAAPVRKKRVRGMARTTREDVRRIIALIAAGYSPVEIRHDMGLTRRQWEYRVTKMHTQSNDAKEAWPKYLGKSQMRYRQFESLRQEAMDDGKLDIARKAISDMARLDKEIIEVGQLMGRYERATSKVEITGPTMSLFHTEGTAPTNPEDSAVSESGQNQQAEVVPKTLH